MNDFRPVKVYIINFWAEGVNIAALQQYLHDSADVIAYWNYIPLVYCIKSRLNAAELTYKLAPFFTPRGFMIAEIDVQNLDGRLVPEAWRWFYLDHHEKSRPPAPIAGFESVFGDPLAPPNYAGLLTSLLKK